MYFDFKNRRGSAQSSDSKNTDDRSEMRTVYTSLSELPNEYGIGSLGDEAYAYVDFLAQTGISRWIMREKTDEFMYCISLDLLRLDGLLTYAECKTSDVFDCAERDALLRTAFSRFWKPCSYSDFFNGEHCGDEYSAFLLFEYGTQLAALKEYAKRRGVTIEIRSDKGCEVL